MSYLWKREMLMFQCISDTCEGRNKIKTDRTFSVFSDCLPAFLVTPSQPNLLHRRNKAPTFHYNNINSLHIPLSPLEPGPFLHKPQEKKKKLDALPSPPIPSSHL